MLLAGLGMGSAPCAVPVDPALAPAVFLLPRVIVRGSPGPSVAVWLSWRIGLDEPRRPREDRGRSGRTEPAPADAEEAAALDVARRCP
jgi:hypothetical protein